MVAFVEDVGVGERAARGREHEATCIYWGLTSKMGSSILTRMGDSDNWRWSRDHQRAGSWSC